MKQRNTFTENPSKLRTRIRAQQIQIFQLQQEMEQTRKNGLAYMRMLQEVLGIEGQASPLATILEMKDKLARSIELSPALLQWLKDYTVEYKLEGYELPGQAETLICRALDVEARNEVPPMASE